MASWVVFCQMQKVFDVQSNAQTQFNDSAKLIRSYDEGLYNEGGVPYRAGFNRKRK